MGGFTMIISDMARPFVPIFATPPIPEYRHGRATRPRHTARRGPVGSSQRRTVRGAALLLLGVLSTVGCKDGSAPPATSDRGQSATAPASQPARYTSTGRYAGSASCEECHTEAYVDWQGSHHAQAQRDVVPALDREAFEPVRSIQHGSQISFAGIEDDRFTLTTMGPEGGPESYRPAGVIGVDPLWQYMIPWGDGRLQVTELAYDPAKKEWFDVYGDEDRQYWEWGHWTGRGMNWNSMCATCHTTDYEKRYDAGTDTYDSRYLEQGVGCEQCHGPMQDHVDWQAEHPDARERYEATGDYEDPTVRRFELDEWIQICGTCHARRSDLTGNYKAGEPFVEHYELVIPDLSDTFYPDGQVRDEDFEYTAFSLSYMHQWGVRCVDCHFPHTAKVARQDNALCQRCHERGISTRRPIVEDEHSHHDPGTEGHRCTDCHMPQTVYMARHWRHDHGMTIPDPVLTKEWGIPNACTRCHEEEGVDWAIQYVEEWYGDRMDRPTRERARLLARLKSGDVQAASGVLDLLQSETNPTWRAVYLKFLQAVVTPEVSPEVRDPVLQAGEARLADGSPLVQATAIELLEPALEAYHGPIEAKLGSPHRLVRIKSAWALRDVVAEDSLAGRDLLDYLHFRRDQPVGAFQWGTYLSDRGDADAALGWFEKAIRWDTQFAPARHRYASALQAMGRSDEAVEVLQQGRAREPDNAWYPYWLGLLYGEIGDIGKARDALRAAVDLNPREARFWHNLALAENGLGDRDAALEAIDHAIQLAPRDAYYVYTRATLLYEAGRFEEALSALDQTQRLDPAEPHYPQMEAEILVILQRYDEAVVALERALSIDPHYAPAQQLMQRLMAP
jgi:tetratricopeptide (TPR) repeat protein